MTNADRIRAMTDEELADSLYLCDKISVDDARRKIPALIVDLDG